MRGTIADLEAKDKFRLKVKIALTSKSETVHYMYKVLKPLEREMTFARARVTIEIANSGELLITGLARDLTSLRSILNGLLKSMYLALKVTELEHK